MKRKKALKQAIEIIEDERRRKFAFDANLYKAGLVSIRTIYAMEHYNNLTEIIEELRKLKDEN